MTRASIWDIRDLRGSPTPPRKAPQQISASLPAPIGSPRLARRTGSPSPAPAVAMAHPPRGAVPDSGARLSTIGRIALRERHAPAGHVTALYGLQRGADSTKRLWPGQFSEAAAACAVAAAQAHASAAASGHGQPHAHYRKVYESGAAERVLAAAAAAAMQGCSSAPVSDAAVVAAAAYGSKSARGSVGARSASAPKNLQQSRATARSDSAPQGLHHLPTGASAVPPRPMPRPVATEQIEARLRPSGVHSPRSPVRVCRSTAVAEDLGLPPMGACGSGVAMGVPQTYSPSAAQAASQAAAVARAMQAQASLSAAVEGLLHERLLSGPSTPKMPPPAAAPHYAPQAAAPPPVSVAAPRPCPRPVVSPRELRSPRGGHAVQVAASLVRRREEAGSPALAHRHTATPPSAAGSCVAQLCSTPRAQPEYQDYCGVPVMTKTPSTPQQRARPDRASAHMASAPQEPSDRIVLYSEARARLPGGGATGGAPGLGAINRDGRSEVLDLWSRADPTQQLQVQRAAAAGALPKGGSMMKPAVPPGGQAGPDPLGGAELEWSSLGEAPKDAIRQWAAGRLGGRHCLLVLEHGGASWSSAGAEVPEPSMEDLRAGAALNVLSGLHAEVGLIFQRGGGDGGTLFGRIFSKTPAQALEEALQSAVAEIGDPALARSPADLTPEQAHLALRRLAMKAQRGAAEAAAAAAGCFQSPGDGATSAAAKGQQAADENTMVQVWLELLRLHTETPGACGGNGGGLGGVKDRAAKEQRPAGGAAAVGSQPWQDAGVLSELGKTEADLEAESQLMSLDALRSQNRAIEEYVMHLVRQRDELRHVARLAEERDSYFILGLEGPDATESEIKKAYRNLARKEHPDKKGAQNHRRFQAIQQAYTNVMRQRKEGQAGGVIAQASASDGDAEAPGAVEPNPAVGEALRYGGEATAAAERVAACAHRAMRGGDEGREAQAMPQRKAFRALRELTRRGVAGLQDMASQLRVLGSAIEGVTGCFEMALAQKHDDNTTVSEIGLRDRATMLEDAGRACSSSAELLEKIAEATEATLRKVDAADAGTAPAGPQPRGARSNGGDANLLRLGSRLLGESLTRIAAVARRSADDAIGGATKALELGRGLVAYDVEQRKERRKAAAKKNFDDDVPMAAPDAPAKDADGDGDADEDVDDDDRPKTPRAKNDEISTPRDQLKSAAKRVKERHVALRVKNLLFLSSLNEEAMRAQAKLRMLLERSQGALLPDVPVQQKTRLFELVAQMLDQALVDCARQAAGNGAVPAKVIDRCLAFVLSLAHGCEIAMPVDSRTQALKLAGLVDLDLLCQVIEGPFRARLIAAGAAKKREPAGNGGYGGHGGHYLPRSRSSGVGIARQFAPDCSTAVSAKAWEDAANSCCGRMVAIIRQAVTPPPPDQGEDATAVVPSG